MQEEKFLYIRKPIPRMDIDKVTGEATYVADLEIPGALWMKLVGSPYPHARILEIDTGEAEKAPGVEAILTGKDFPFRIGHHIRDREVFAQERALYVGHPVAAVIAESLEAAERAAELIKIKYEPLPYVLDPVEAMKPDAPILHPKLGEYEHLPFLYPIPGTNIAHRFKLRKGSIEAGEREADVIVEEEYRLPMLHHSYLEPWGAVARVRSDGTIEIWSSTQGPFAVRTQLAHSLHIPESKIIVHYLYVGGGFGAKSDLFLEYFPVLASMKLNGRPVKLILNREESFYYGYHRGEYILRMRTGARRSDGKIVFHRGEYIYGTGHAADLGSLLGNTVGWLATGPYDIPNVWVDSYTVYTNKPTTTAFRNYTHTELWFAFEQQMDILAEKLGLDPVEFRLRNLIRPGVSTLPSGQPVTEDWGDPEGVLRRAAELIEWGKEPEQPKEPWKKRAKAIVMAPKGPSMPPNITAAAVVKLNEDGSVDLLTGVAELGQGTMNSLAMMVAEELQIPLEKVRVYGIDRDTSNAPYDWETCASRATFAIGQAVQRAVADLKEQIRQIASQVFRVDPSSIEIRDGKAIVKGEPWKAIRLEELAMGYTFPDGHAIYGQLIGRGSWVPRRTTGLDENGRGHPLEFVTYSAQAVEIEVDILNGKIDVLRAAVAVDTPYINKILALGQVYGGALMGMNMALREEIKFDGTGKILNPGFTDYKLPRAGDVPKNISIDFIVTRLLHDAPYGAKGLAEVILGGWPAAVANALYRATGVRVKMAPLTQERVIEEIKKQRPELIEQALRSIGGE
ncbi:MAG: xanthine dehydrogenase family protein molybdopterin-binding subunit [Fervidicoccaceae archaeon]